MKQLSEDTKFAHLGKPGTSFSKGFQRRLDKILKRIDLTNKVILDQGSGEGVWLTEFAKFTDPKNIYAQDIDAESKEVFAQTQNSQQNAENENQKSKIPLSNYHICPAEQLDFKDNYFDIVFSNEVLEHVEDDQKAVDEALRVLKPGGLFIIFTPNRGWPFETHGMFLRGKYYWGNIPFLPWMPRFVRKKLAPHVRNYSNGQIKKLFQAEERKSKWEFIHHSHVFPGFDGAVRRFGFLGKILQKVFFTIEKTPLHFFGISHFVIVKKK